MRTFFGLSPKYMESVYEQIFSMMHHGNWSFSETYSLPVGLRYWFFNRMVKQFDDEKSHHEQEMKKARKR
jgi:hypothetical protein